MSRFNRDSGPGRPARTCSREGLVQLIRECTLGKLLAGDVKT